VSDVVSSENNVRLRALIRGRVQGVFFRNFARYHAQGLGLVGWVSNLSDSRTVEVIAEGHPSDLKKLLRNLRDGPPSADVDSYALDVSESLGEFGSFEIC